MTMRLHPTLPWCTKVGLGLGLIAHFAVLAFFPGLLPTSFRAPYPVFLSLVLLGGGVTLGHHAVLARSVGRAGERALVTAGGLFRWLRHPMYLGDALLYLGFAVHPATPVSLIAFPAAVWALVAQARREDAAMAQRFGAAHDDWRRRTWLLVPGL